MARLSVAQRHALRGTLWPEAYLASVMPLAVVLRRARTLHSSGVGQKAKYSLGADVFRFAPESGLKTDIAGGPFRANRRLTRR